MTHWGCVEQWLLFELEQTSGVVSNNDIFTSLKQVKMLCCRQIAKVGPFKGSYLFFLGLTLLVKLIEELQRLSDTETRNTNKARHYFLKQDP